MKKLGFLVVAIVSLVGFVGITLANGSSSTWHDTVHNNGLNFKASYYDGVVSTSWTQFNSLWDHNWKYWKVVRSTTKAHPIYPDDSYIKYDSNRAFLNYVDKNPPKWTVYYGICAIHSSSVGKHRDCDWQAVNVWEEIYSDSTSISNTNIANTSTSTSTVSSSVSGLSDAMKSAIDSMVTKKFIPSLEAKFPDVNNQISKLEGLVSAIGLIISKNPDAKNSSIFLYLKEIIQDTLDIKKVEALLSL